MLLAGYDSLFLSICKPGQRRLKEGNASRAKYCVYGAPRSDPHGPHRDLPADISASAEPGISVDPGKSTNRFSKGFPHPAPRDGGHHDFV